MNETGEIDLNRSKEIVRTLASVALSYRGHDIIVDLRETTLTGAVNFGAVLELSLEFARYGSFVSGKLANLVPHDREWLTVARQFEASLQIQGFAFKVFTSFEEAIDWFSEIIEKGYHPDPGI